MKKMLAGLTLISPAIAAADYGNIALQNSDATGLINKVQYFTLGSLIGGGLKLILIIAALVFFFMLVFGGIQWISSGGDKAQTENARNRITAALIGLIIVFAAWAINGLLGVFFGIDIFNFVVPTVT